MSGGLNCQQAQTMIVHGFIDYFVREYQFIDKYRAQKPLMVSIYRYWRSVGFAELDPRVCREL